MRAIQIRMWFMLVCTAAASKSRSLVPLPHVRVLKAPCTGRWLDLRDRRALPAQEARWVRKDRRDSRDLQVHRDSKVPRDNRDRKACKVTVASGAKPD